MVLFIFTVMCIMMLYFDYKVNKRVMSLFSIFVFPYLGICVLNNLIAVRFGYFVISDSVLWMILGGISFFFIGSTFTNIVFQRRVKKSQIVLDYQNNHKKFNHYKIRYMLCYVLLIEGIFLLRFLFMVANSGSGIQIIASEQFSEEVFGGIVTHLFMTTYPLLPILFLFWLYNRKRVLYLVAPILGIMIWFLSFTKYHVLSIILLIFIFVSYENRAFFKKGMLIVSIMITSIFALNYMVSFWLRGVLSLIDRSFYGSHLWGYIAGSLIYNNSIFTRGIRTGVNIFYKLGTFLFALPNMFFNRIFDTTYFQHEQQQFLLISNRGDRSNVTDAIGYLYPSHGTLGDIFLFLLVFLLIGAIFTRIYNQSTRRPERFNMGAHVFSVLFVAFSFFGTFYINPMPWEITIFAYFIPALFINREKKES